MNIDRMRVAVRPMSSVQAIDLGMMMARQWFLPLWKIWLGMALPFFLLIYIGMMLLGASEVISNAYLGSMAGLVFWWCKPLYEKPMMTWLGQALFSTAPTIKESLKQGWHWHSLKQYSLTLLIRHRLSLRRQLILPILLLERPNRQEFRQRLPILSRGQGGAVGWNTTILVNVELMISIAIVIVIIQLIPTAFMSAETFFDYLELAPIWLELLWACFYFLAASVVAPFFVAGGFAVYLTKRCLLEGWDVELVFKQLCQRYEQAQANPLHALANPVSQNQVSK